jgi:hypothetical protein
MRLCSAAGATCDKRVDGPTNGLSSIAMHADGGVATIAAAVNMCQSMRMCAMVQYAGVSRIAECGLARLVITGQSQIKLRS